MKPKKSRSTIRQSTIRHVIHVADGRLITIDGAQRTEVNYRTLRRLNTLAALEAAFAGMGFSLIKRAPDQLIYEKQIRPGVKPMTKPCVYPGCDQPRKVSTSGKVLTWCTAHEREYWRRHQSGNWDGWQNKRRGKPKTDAPRTPKRAPTAPAAASTPPVRILALRCDTCGIKYPYTDEHFDVAGQSRTCRRCAGARVVTIVDPISNTARHARLIMSDGAVSCGEGAEAYAAFARAEKAAGHQVVIEW